MLSVLAQGGGGQFSWQNFFQIAIILIAVGSSAIGWLFKKLTEQAAIKRQREQRDRARHEALRTGRAEASQAPEPALPPAVDTGGAEADARRRLQELAQRRRAELERLARQASGSPSSPSPRPSTPRPRTPTEPPRRTVPPVTSPPQPAPRSMPRPAPVSVQRVPQGRGAEASRQDLERRRREQAKREKQQREREAARRRGVVVEEPETTHRLVADSPAEPMAEPVPPRLSVDALRSMRASDLRNAFVMSVVLQKPTAESEDEWLPPLMR